MKKDFAEELDLLVKNIDPAENGFVFRGQHYKVDPATRTENKLKAASALMTQVLYGECYAKKLMHQNSEKMLPVQAAYADESHFVEQLSSHNHSAGMSDPGWTVSNLLLDGYVQVQKYGVSRTMHMDRATALNEVVTFVSKKEDKNVQKGFYYVHSNEIFEYAPTAIRIYWNIVPEGAGELISGITSQFNHYRLPFLFKCLSNPAHYHRRDACVLYIQQRYLAQARVLLSGINRNIDNNLQNDVPLFTHKLRNGVGIAESPIDGMSFGMSRMSIVANGLLEAFKSEAGLPEARLSFIDSAFRNAGINPEYPFLETGSCPGLFNI